MDYGYLARRDMKVFVVEDSAAVRERLVEMIRDVKDIEVVGEAATYDTAVAGIINTRPDVAVLDIKLANDNRQRHRCADRGPEDAAGHPGDHPQQLLDAPASEGERRCRRRVLSRQVDRFRARREKSSNI